MTILYGGVAYRRTVTPGNEQEMNTWELSKPIPTLIHCPHCPSVEYGLIVEVDASQAEVEDFMGRVRMAMEHGCPNHPQRIRIDEP